MAPEHFLHKRVAEALAAHPPFNELGGEPLLILAENIEIVYVDSERWLFEYGQSLHDKIYFVEKGTLVLWKEDVLVDHVEPGELVGLRSLFESGTYKAGARAVQGKDALVYGIPVELAKEYLVNNPSTEHFFQLDWKGNSENFVPSGTSLRRLMKSREGKLILPIAEQQQQLEAAEALALPQQTPVIAVAQAMRRAKSDAAVLVDELRRPLGIITDKDLRNFLGSDQFSMDSTAQQMMTSPVKTFPPTLHYADAMVAMVEKRIHHLVITENGSAESPLVGIISDHEILLEQALNPTIIIKGMERAQSFSALERAAKKVEQLRMNYIRANVSTAYLLKVMGTFYSAMYASALRLAEADLGTPPCGFAWLALGSLGRGEQIIRTDQDHALVYAEDGHDSYFEQLALKTSAIMQELGFEEDHFGVSATGAMWRGTPAQWTQRLGSWINDGEGDALLRLSIISDARVIAGDLSVALETFNEFYVKLSAAQTLLHTMAKDALRNPSPLGMFKQFKLERSGQFDLKLRAILPFIDAAKVLAAFAGKAHITGTTARLEAIKDESNAELIASSIHAYEILLELRSKFAQENNEQGRYINPDDLDSLDKQLLRNVLKTLEALQSHLKLKFKL